MIELSRSITEVAESFAGVDPGSYECTRDDIAQLTRAFEEMEQTGHTALIRQLAATEKDDRFLSLSVMFALMQALANRGVEPFASSIDLLPEEKPNWHSLPRVLRYLARPASKWGEMTGDEWAPILQSLQGAEKEALVRLAARVRSDRTQIEQWIRSTRRSVGHTHIHSAEAERVYCLLVFLEEVENLDAGPIHLQVEPAALDRVLKDLVSIDWVWRKRELVERLLAIGGRVEVDTVGLTTISILDVKVDLYVGDDGSVRHAEIPLLLADGSADEATLDIGPRTRAYLEVVDRHAGADRDQVQEMAWQWSIPGALLRLSAGLHARTGLWLIDASFCDHGLQRT
jgi:hypothetical protein